MVLCWGQTESILAGFAGKKKREAARGRQKVFLQSSRNKTQGKNKKREGILAGFAVKCRGKKREKESILSGFCYRFAR